MKFIYIIIISIVLGLAITLFTRIIYTSKGAMDGSTYGYPWPWFTEYVKEMQGGQSPVITTISSFGFGFDFISWSVVALLLILAGRNFGNAMKKKVQK